MLAGDVAAQLDRQIRDAARRIENTGRDDRLRRTGFEAERAGAALIDRRRIHLERQAADDCAEKHPRSELRVDHARVLADPPDARVLRVDALLNRTGVDIRARLERLRPRFAHPRDERVEPRADDGVIVVAPGVARDPRAVGIGALGRVRTIGVVDRGRDDHRARRRHDVANVGPTLGRAVQVRHLAGVPAIEPLAKEFQLGMRRRGCYPAGVKAESKSVGFDVRGAHVRARGQRANDQRARRQRATENRPRLSFVPLTLSR